MQKDEFKEIENLIKTDEQEKSFEERIADMTESEISEEFFNNYKKLCLKYKRDFMQKPPEIIKLDIPDMPNTIKQN